MSKQKIVVVGNGMVSHRFCELFAERNLHQDFELSVFGEEPLPAYDRVHLSSFFDGKTETDLLLGSREWYREAGAKLHLGRKIVSIDTANQKVTDDQGASHEYDKLVLAMGSYPLVPPISGVQKKGVFVYRTVRDLYAIKDYAASAESAAILGGGLLGLEAAKAMLDLKLETHVIEFAPRLMPRQIDASGSSLLQNKIESLGISLRLNAATTQVLGDEKVEGLAFKEGPHLLVDMLVISAGIRPRDEVAREAGLKLGERGGVLVDDYMRASEPNVYAMGEVASHQNFIYGLVAPGYAMAETALSHITGEDKPFKGGDLSTKLKLLGVDVASFGDAFGESPESKTISYINETGGIYKRITLSKHDNYLMGGMLVGDAADYNKLLQTMKNRTQLPKTPEDLILGSRNGEDADGMSVAFLPDSSQICSCNNVSKGEIVQAVRDGVTEIGPLKTCTKAGTGCGGCLPMVQDILNGVLVSEGKTVNNHLCEHFAYTRQELYDLVRVNRIKTFSDLIQEYGSGRGCEICKPAVASILASTWNDMILEHAPLQDTNDRYLANIQRGGTYSVVPRVPGGEILPEKLIALGEVARKYNLYCKITGGQRIDLFGAELQQLPDIWEELIEAGFESGHAYGKALRTVKSCVGDTWCRYGVQDSVGFAVRLENRYKGIRSPHKMKSACSGCVRECAEAQSKDFGVVATEKGWNLYVCGNGGAKPQHGLLLAGDLDEDTVVRYLDRFIMYYIRTADKLTRTATWFNKLEGGIEYLRSVIIDDSLGLCETLEQEMAHLVDTYACEWKQVVENPEKRKQFQYFINDDGADDNLRWKNERQQKKPANWETQPDLKPEMSEA